MKTEASLQLKNMSLKSAYRLCYKSLHSFYSYIRLIFFVDLLETNKSDTIVVKVWSRSGRVLENLGQGIPRKITIKLIDVGENTQVNITIEPLEPITMNQFSMARNFWIDFIPLYAKRLGVELSPAQLDELYTADVLKVRLSYLNKIYREVLALFVFFFLFYLGIQYVSIVIQAPPEPFMVRLLGLGLILLPSLLFIGDYYERKRFINKIISKKGCN